MVCYVRITRVFQIGHDPNPNLSHLGALPDWGVRVEVPQHPVMFGRGRGGPASTPHAVRRPGARGVSVSPLSAVAGTPCITPGKGYVRATSAPRRTCMLSRVRLKRKRLVLGRPVR